MSVIISSKSNLTLAGVTFHCTGEWKNKQWIIISKWDGSETLTASKLVKAILNKSLSKSSSSKFPAISFENVTGKLKPETSFSFSGTSSVSWPKPFGVNLGLKIENLGFTLAHKMAEKGTNTLQAFGKVKVAGQEVNVNCYFKDTSPVFILVDKIPSLSWAEVSSHFGLNLPSNFFNISFANNQIYYLEKGQTASQTSLLPSDLTAKSGLNVASNVTLELAGITFPAVDVNVNTDRDVAIKGTFDKAIPFIDSKILKLTGANPMYTGGPTLRTNLKSSSPTLGLACGFEFLGLKCGNAGMTVSKDKKGNIKFTGKLAYPNKIGTITNPSLDVSYSKAKGLQVTNWPAFVSKGLLTLKDFLKAIKHINNHECGSVKNSVRKKLKLAAKKNAPTFKTSFTIIPTLGTSLSGNTTQLKITLNGTYSILTSTPPTETINATQKSNDIVICSVPLPTLNVLIPIPTSFSFSTIKTEAIQLINKKVKKIVSQLLNERAALIKFLAVFVGVKELKKQIENVCDKKEEGDDNDGGDGDQPSTQDQLKDFFEVAGDELEIAGEPIAIVGDVAAVVGTMVATGLGGCSSGGGGGHGHHNGGHSSGSHGNSAPNIQPLPKPTLSSNYPFVKPSHPNQKQWEVSWPPIQGACYYQAILYSGKNLAKVVIVPPAASGNTKTYFKIPPDMPQKNVTAAPPYSCKVIAIAYPGLNNDSPQATIRITQLDEITSFKSSLNTDENKINFSFKGVSNAENYDIKLIDAENGTMVEKQTLSQTNNQQLAGSFQLSGSAADLSSYQISVKATAANYISSEVYTSSTKQLQLGIGHMAIGSTFIIH
ncbi:MULTISPECIES: hypothetical protein [unclassified Tenacibaculum]|uniref:hypothetical protein n=1 Tax=unclassified Tenacibaculum TaxID=2635139 RepID=UPI001F3B2C7F|nr:MULTISPECIES: hypothetical protein [unclassified Tenacibaculum]MCF2874784.1 hypothetical protein [Tenacibaculum sp. Cn5-1]MCF2934150.1 hypothetical protein [Tenacibaculum sp. Cn5-34]MCG7510360.1 hypothetical protein [Tenacibaculum sp. Cn5-46]